MSAHRIRMWCILLFLLTGCSALGSRSCLEQNDRHTQWVRWTSPNGMYAPGNNSFCLCDSNGFVSVEFAEPFHVISWGPILLPLIPERLREVSFTRYLAAVVLQTTAQPPTPDMLASLRFAFNSPQNEQQPRLESTDNYRSLSTLPPCADTTADSTYPWLIHNSRKFFLSFDIHPDSVSTVFVTADTSFTRQTGIVFSALHLHKSKRLYYMPFTFFAH